MDFNIKEAVEGMKTLSFERLEELKDRCGRQTIYWATSDPAKLEMHREEIRLCSQLVNHFGEKYLNYINNGVDPKKPPK